MREHRGARWPWIGGTCLVAAIVSLGCDCGGATPRGRSDTGVGTDANAEDPLAGLTALRVEPAEATIEIVDGAPGSQAFRAFGTFPDGEREVTDEVGWGVLPTTLGTFSAVGAVLTPLPTAAGEGRVSAASGSVRGSARVRIRVRATFEIAPTRGAAPLPASPATLFGGAEDASRVPRLVYPNDGVVLPPNLGRIEVHWLRGSASNTLFEVRFASDLLDVRAYVRCERPEGIREDGCIFEASGRIWQQVAAAARGGAPVTITVRATDDDGSAVGTSGSITARIARDDLDGTLYYWSTTRRGVLRYDFGSDMPAAEAVLMPEQAEGRCVGCHAISRDGRRIVASVGGIGSGGMLLYDLESFTPLRAAPNDRILQFGSFSPDGTQLVGVYGDDARGARGLLFFDTRCDAASMATCGQVTGDLPIDGREASHPSWSPDGSAIAYTDVGRDSSSQRPLHGAIGIVRREGAGWGAPGFLVPRAAGISRYNPDWSPDGSLIVYNESTCPGGDVAARDCNADSDPTATVWVVSEAGGTPVELARAMAPGAMDEGRTELNDTFPRWAPFEFVLDTGDAGDRRLFWVSFASTRAYGLRSAPGGNAESGGRGTYLWLSAVLPDAALRGEDPSSTAFALPFQDLDSSNHIAVWTTRSVGEIPLE